MDRQPNNCAHFHGYANQYANEPFFCISGRSDWRANLDDFSGQSIVGVRGRCERIEHEYANERLICILRTIEGDINSMKNVVLKKPNVNGRAVAEGATRRGRSQ